MAICISPNELNTKWVATQPISALTGRLMALFAAGGVARGDVEVVWAMGLLWGEGGGNYG